MPPKAVAALRFVNSKTIGDYITEENMLTSWGGQDDYEFKFEPQKPVHTDEIKPIVNCQNGTIITKDENDNTTFVNQEKKVGLFV